MHHEYGALFIVSDWSKKKKKKKNGIKLGNILLNVGAEC